MQISFLIRGNEEFGIFMDKLRSLIHKYGHEKSFIALMDTDRFDYEDEGLEDF